MPHRAARPPRVRLAGWAGLALLIVLGAVAWIAWHDEDGPPESPRGAAPRPFVAEAPAPMGRSAAREPAEAAAPAALRFTLLELGVARSGRELAVLQVNGGPPSSFVVGDVVSVGVRLARILPDAVELQRSTATQRIALAAEVSRSATNASAAARSDADARRLARADEAGDVIVRPTDQPPPSSSGITRAIARTGSAR